MKVKSVPASFKPVTITLETWEELWDLHYLIKGDTFISLAGRMSQLSPEVKERLCASKRMMTTALGLEVSIQLSLGR